MVQLSLLGIETLNPMQLSAMQAFSDSRHLLLLSPTGSGKTLAYLLPLLEVLRPDANTVQAVIIVPSRELALQIEAVFKQLGSGFQVTSCYGGHPVKTEKNNLKSRTDVVVGTPGRLAMHLREGTLDFSQVHCVILDEFDKSLELGFSQDMHAILRRVPEPGKRVLTSATPLPEVPEFVRLNNPVTLNFLPETAGVPSRLRLQYLRAEGNEKVKILSDLLAYLGTTSSLVFFNHREAVERIYALFKGHALSMGLYHGGLSQEERERELIKFRNGTTRCLLTTDLASRGLDIPDTGAVIHYQLPLQEEVFIHRNGRTARMRAEGTAYLLLAETDHFPAFLSALPEVVNLGAPAGLPCVTDWETLYVDAGKKDKISKSDILGMFIQQGGLQTADIGRIDCLDYCSYVAIRRNRCREFLQAVQGKKLKNKRIGIRISD